MNITKYKETFIVSSVFVCLFLICLTELGYISYLRKKVSSEVPQNWQHYYLNGSPTLLVPWFDSIRYASKVNQIRIHGFPYDPFIKENRSFSSWIIDSFTFYFIYLVSAPFNRIDMGWTVCYYLTIGLWFLFIYIFFRKIFFNYDTNLKYKIWTLISVSLIPVCLGGALDGLMFDWVTFKFNLGKNLFYLINFGFMNRGVNGVLPSPILTSHFLFIWIACLLYHLSKKESHSWVIDGVLGLAGASLLLIHIPEWVFGMAVLGTLWLFVLFYKRDFSFTIKPLTRILATALLGSLFYLWIRVSGSPVGDFPNRVSIPFHNDISQYLTGLFGILAIIRGIRRPGDRVEIKLFWIGHGCSLVAGLMLFNVNYIIKGSMDFSIMSRFTNVVLKFMICALLIEWSLNREMFHQHSYKIAAVILALTFFNVKSFAEKHFMLAGIPQSWEESFRWLDQNTKKDDKILSVLPVLHYYFSIFTHMKVQVADGHPILSTISTQENLNRLAVLIKTLGINPKVFSDQLYHGTSHSSSNEYSYFSTSGAPQSSAWWNEWDIYARNVADLDGADLKKILFFMELQKLYRNLIMFG